MFVSAAVSKPQQGTHATSHCQPMQLSPLKHPVCPAAQDKVMSCCKLVGTVHSCARPCKRLNALSSPEAVIKGPGEVRCKDECLQLQQKAQMKVQPARAMQTALLVTCRYSRAIASITKLLDVPSFTLERL